MQVWSSPGYNVQTTDPVKANWQKFQSFILLIKCKFLFKLFKYKFSIFQYINQNLVYKRNRVCKSTFGLLYLL